MKTPTQLARFNRIQKRKRLLRERSRRINLAFLDRDVAPCESSDLVLAFELGYATGVPACEGRCTECAELCGLELPATCRKLPI
jgi:hypothetical protein